MMIANKKIDGDGCCFIVAEIGINHNGDVETAKKLIDAASLAGCDAVKFQKRTIDIVYTKEELEKPRRSHFGETNGDLKRGLEFGISEYYDIDNYCRSKGIMWFASAWDEDSVDFLEAFDIPCYKIASACITDMSLLGKIRRTGKPVIMSTGGSDGTQIQNALDILRAPDESGIRNHNLGILACTALYPCSLGLINLKKIDTLKALYPEYAIGYSNHSPGLWMMLAAVAMGAKIIEFHLTLDRAMWGSDQAASIEVGGAIKIVKEIRDMEKAVGDGMLRCMDEERPTMEKLRRFK